MPPRILYAGSFTRDGHMPKATRRAGRSRRTGILGKGRGKSGGKNGSSDRG